MQSAIYQGWVRHRRYLPVSHAFRYRMFMMYLDLDELPALFNRRWLWSADSPNLAWMRRSDYLGDPAQPLRQAVDQLVQARTGAALRGPVRLLTHMRYFGHCFNPVSFYYCFETDGVSLQAIVADIVNTPWKQRHAYVLDCAGLSADKSMHFQFAKDFHVSPFMPMHMDYDWRFSQPQQVLHVHMQNLDPAGRMFDATLQLQRRELTGWALASVLTGFPFMTLQVVFAIYWQALRLWLKNAPFIAHPDSLDKPS